MSSVVVRSGQDAYQIGARRELLLDDYLVAELNGDARFQLHRPARREIALVCDRPWEGTNSHYITVLGDGALRRMYYKGGNHRFAAAGKRVVHDMHIAVVESADGITWSRPELDHVRYGDEASNNIVWAGAGEHKHGVHGFTPLLDDNPAAEPAARYKAVGADHGATRGAGLHGMRSADGLRWELIQQEPICTDGKFDSQNLAFWDAERGEYRLYLRDFRGGHPGGRRDIRTAVSADFVNWSTPQWLEYPGAADEQLYTNAVQPYYRAPHIFVGFPARYVERSWTDAIEDLPELEARRRRSAANERYGAALTEGLFMSSRDGQTFQRWAEAFLPPGPQLTGNWAYGDNYLAAGILETPSAIEGAPPELSLFASEHRWRAPSSRIRRFTLRLDGFVSLQAPMSGGGFLTHPLVFTGSHLELNVATSAAGGLRVELADAEGRPLGGFSLADCVEVIGDQVDRRVRWRGGADISALAGRAIRMRVVMADGDLYAFRFAA